MGTTFNAFLLLSIPFLNGCPAPVDGPSAGGSAFRMSVGGGHALRVVTVAEGLEHPWGMAFLPDGDGVLVTERTGRLRLVDDGGLHPDAIEGVPPVRAEGESGLLDVAIHPRFRENRLVYFSYAKPGERGSTTAIARGRLEAGRLMGVEDVFVADAWGSAAVNHGGRLLFDRDGRLFATIGDRREMERAQDLGDHAGTTVRLLDDGRIPPDNPFLDRRGALPEIYSYGHRNPLGLAIHPETGEIWQSENGPSGGDEINRLEPGRNYGWPLVSFGNHYDGRRIPDHRPDDGMAPPLHYWVPSISPSGLTIYSGERFPDWRGDILSGSLQARHLNRLRFEDARAVDEERLLIDRAERVRDVRTGPDGFLYLLVDSPTGSLLRIEPEGR